MKLSDDSVVTLTAAGVLLVGAWWAAGSIRQAATAAAHAVNPLSRENVFYEAVNATGAVLVDDPAGPGMNADGSWSLGGWLYDIFH